MLEMTNNGLRYFQFESLLSAPLDQGIFARQGGVSPKPWASLNLGGTVGDDRTNVIENRKRVFLTLRRPVSSVLDSWQVHGTEILFARSPRGLESPHKKADAIVTDSKSVTLMMRFADCVPIFFYAPKEHLIAIAHAGWKGTLGKIAANVVEYLKTSFAIRPQSLLTGIGPSIGPDHYAIGHDVESLVLKEFPESYNHLLSSDSFGNVFLNLWKGNEIILRNAGVDQIETCQICTACNTQDWYSHRMENGKTGRFAAVLGLR